MVGEHEKQFPYLGLFACHVMEFVGSQIKIEWIFNMVGVITNLK
jgi:hypothetical protein